MKSGRLAVVVISLLFAVALSGCVSEFPGLWWLFGDDGASSPASGAPPAAAPAVAPAVDTGSGASPVKRGATVSCHYSERLQCWCEFSNPESELVNYFWTVNGATVNAGQTNASDVAHTIEPAAPGEYLIEVSVRFPDGTWANATTAETVPATAGSSEGGAGGSTDECPSGVYILGVCADED